MNFSRCMLVDDILVFATIQVSSSVSYFKNKVKKWFPNFFRKNVDKTNKYQSSLHCWQQKCHECPDDQKNGPYTDVMCQSWNLVDNTWLKSSQQYSQFSVSHSTDNFEFQCVKLIASNPNIVGDSTDVIRGCVLKSRAKQLCKDLKNIELEKRKTNSVCKICDKDMCNGAMRQGVTSIFLIFLRIFAKFLFH
ncbi:uncharacterized protein LOC143916447 isoform X1 [Arctopsyche grandis]|uniref:uncharacterized protein LOC143916447 isoform X1 n=1 Tax=Arctopsyche grandis TaxID=121162 RepID=UPI00406DA44E